ncbi:MAG: hypothetical protein A3G15_02295 [Candidatus Levybacteria bacterium RIFCSPLOWO2_12_FULL_40_10]|nr:MAG: hypothetical protein A3G15_02295 [Candidatus Levybacteria bacterium RIFCSPLOWO2_12_FULL_40_10]
MNPRERKPQGSELDQALRFGKEVVTRARQFSGEFLLSSKERLTKPSEVEIMDKIVNSGIRNFVWFHCSITDTMQQAVVEKARKGELRYFNAVSEHSLPSIAVGIWLATGEPSLVHFQNSGIGNAQDGITTAYVHEVPMLVMPTWRGNDKSDNSEPHQEIGDMTQDLMKTIFKGKNYGERDGRGFLRKLEEGIDIVKAGGIAGVAISPRAFNKTVKLEIPPRLRERTAESYWEERQQLLKLYEENASIKGQESNPIRFGDLVARSEAIGAIIEQHPNSAIIICNGFNARTAYWQHDRLGNLPNVAGMGGSAAIGYGAAWANPDIDWVVIDGDQNFEMSTMHAVLADSKNYPPNLYWYILDNGIGASVGTAESVPLPPWAENLARLIPTRTDNPGEFSDSRVPDPAEIAKRFQRWVMRESRENRARREFNQRFEESSFHDGM